MLDKTKWEKKSQNVCVRKKNQNVVKVLLRSKDQCKNDHISNLFLSDTIRLEWKSIYAVAASVMCLPST